MLHVDQQRARTWSAIEVIERWTQLFALPTLIDRYQLGVASGAERERAEQLIEHWRQRLCDISWYMRCLNEHLARRANAEDQCTGRFWEGRFKSQALLDEAGLLTAMAYVDLNPVRAGIAAIPEAAEFTSIHARICRHLADQAPANPVGARAHDTAPRCLLPFRDTPGRGHPRIPFAFADYLQLVDWSGRMIRANKVAAIDACVPPIMQRLNIDARAWQLAMAPCGNAFGRALGRIDRLRLHAKALGQAWVRGLHQAKRMYRTT